MTWYDRINGAAPAPAPQPNPGYSGMPFMNPMQRMNAIQQAMQNPSAFVRQALPNIPADVAADPNRVLMYMKQNCGLTDMDIQAAASRMQRGW